MPTVEKVRGGRVYLRTLERRFSVGDRADVDEEEAEYLTEVRGDFDVVDGDGGEDFEINGWLDNDYQDRAEAVLEGGLDDYLDEIEEAETSSTVKDAIDDRRSELQED